MDTIEKSLKNTKKAEPAKNLQWLYSWVGMKLRKGKIPEEAFSPKKGGAFVGGMFIYEYDPKTKEQLEWWDELPLVIPFALHSDGFTGLNLHYIPPMLRAKLLDKLVEFKKRANTPRAYMQISYEFLQGAVKSELFAPCIKRYLVNHIRSPLIRVSDEYWEKVAKLPLQQFRYANAQTVWNNPSGTRKKRKKK